MFASIATLTRRGLVLRALAGAAFISAAACQNADRALGPSALAFNPNLPDPAEQADLAVQSISYGPANPLVGLQMRFTAVVKNVGSLASDASTLNFQIPAEIQDAQTWVNVPALQPGQTVTVERLATHLSAGSYVARATVADTGTSHGNDSKTVSYTVVQGTAQADLIVKRLTHTPDYTIDAYNFQFTAVVANLGLTTAAPSILSFSGWAQASYSLMPIGIRSWALPPCSLPLADGQVWVPALAPGQEYVVQWNAQLQLGPGQYQIVATANSRQCAAEANLSNTVASDVLWVYHEII